MTPCAVRGFHIRPGSGNGTNSESILWAEQCRDCGTPLGDWSFDYTAEADEPSTVNPKVGRASISETDIPPQRDADH